LFAAFHEIGVEHRVLRPEFIDLRSGSLNSPNEPFGVVIQANIDNEQERYPQNTVDVADWPGVIFAEKPVQTNELIEP
jgi:hypothetical protein